MREYIEKVLHQNVEISIYECNDCLPLGLSKAFKLYVAKINNNEFIIAEPVEQLNLIELRKAKSQLEKYTNFLIAFYLTKVNWYSLDKMIDENIPFIWENHQIYLPFFGVFMQEGSKRIIKDCKVISFLTQKLLLMALYDNWQNVKAVQAARKLNVSRMSITRCYDEIETIGLPFLKENKKTRCFCAIEDKKEMWNCIYPILRNPIIREFRLTKKPNIEMIYGGVTALSEYSLIDCNKQTTYVVTKEQLGASKIKDIREVPNNEEPECIVQEIGYVLPFKEYKAVDPLSLSLMLKNDEADDPRVEKSIKEMLEEYVW